MQEQLEYRHYFCEQHGREKKDISAPDIQVSWETAPENSLPCGMYTERFGDQIATNRGIVCGKVSSMVLVGIGGNPIIFI